MEPQYKESVDTPKKFVLQLLDCLSSCERTYVLTTKLKLSLSRYCTEWLCFNADKCTFVNHEVIKLFSSLLVTTTDLDEIGNILDLLTSIRDLIDRGE